MSETRKPLTRADLLSNIDASWNELRTYLESLSEAQLTRPTDAAGWTAKDHVMHIALWASATLAMMEGKSKREALNIPVDVWALDDDDPVNAILQERTRDVPLEQVMTTLRQTHQRILDKLNTMTDADLLLPLKHYQAESSAERPIIDYIDWDITHHYVEHIPWIAAIVEKA